MSFGAEYRDKVLVIANAFKNSDPEIQYIARRDLEVLVSEATAPGSINGAGKITDDLLHALSKREVSNEAKKYILRQLARVGTSRAVGPLSRIMNEKDSRLAEEARAAIESIPGSKASSALKKAYAKSDDNGKVVMLTSLARRGEASSVGFLARQLDSDSERIARTAAWALGEIGSGSAYSTLRRSYDRVASKQVKMEIERSLLSDPQIDAALLYRIFSEGSDVASRRAALKVLIRREDRGVSDAVAAALASEEADLRTIAIESALSSGIGDLQDLVLGRAPLMGQGDLAAVLGGLGRVDRGRAESTARQIYESGDETLQLAALELLGKVGSEKSVDLLLDTLADGKRAYQIKAASALAALDVAALDQRLIRMLGSGESEKVLLAQEVLTYRNIPDSKTYLLDAVRGDHGPIARGALKTLSVIADGSDLEELYEIAMSKTGDARRVIVSLLKKLAPEFGSADLNERLARL